MIRTIFVVSLAAALCACTSQQYAQFNQRINDSISDALGTRTKPPPTSEWKAETSVDYVPDVPASVPSAQERADAAYASHIAGLGSVPQVTFTPTPKPKQPTARGISPVDDGAIVCPGLDEVNWLFQEIGRARVARSYMPEQARQLAKLQDGYDPWAEPKPSDYRCQFVPTGTPLNVKWQGGIPIVFGKMSDGRPFAGVTLPNMIDR